MKNTFYKMIIPIRCVTCNKVLADKWEKFAEMTKKGRAKKIISIKPIDFSEKTLVLKAFETLHITRYCCRRHLLSHIDLLEEI